jgi:hypothetical protein
LYVIQEEDIIAILEEEDLKWLNNIPNAQL